MTRDKAINILARLAGGATQPSWDEIRKAAQFACNVLSASPEDGVHIQFNDERTFKKEQPQGLDEAKSKYWNYTGSGITDFATFKKAADFFYRQGCIDTEDKIRNAKPEDFGEISCQSVGLNEAAEAYLIGNGDKHIFGMEYRKLDMVAGFKAGAKWMAEQGYSQTERVYNFNGENVPCMSTTMYLPKEFKIGDKVIVQIRKKEE